MLTEIANALTHAWAKVAGGVVPFLPRLIAALLLVVAGWLLAALARTVVRRVLGWVGFHRLAERAGATELLAAAEMPRADALLAGLAFWGVWLWFLVAAIEALQVPSLRVVVDGLVVFMPRLLLSLVILALGFLLANLLWRGALLAAVNARMPSARLVAGGLRLLVIAIASAMALDHLGLARGVVLTAFAITFGAVMLGLALAFGLGGRALAQRMLDEQFAPRPRGEDDAARHL
jgi:hypothetical protein